jgi:hypothetical protein
VAEAAASVRSSEAIAAIRAAWWVFMVAGLYAVALVLGARAQSDRE